MRSQLIRLILFGIAVAGGHGAIAQRLQNSVPIQIRSPSAPPRHVSFQDVTVGQIRFSPFPDYFEGLRPDHGAVVMHVINLDYGDDVMPLRVRTRYDRQRLQLEIAGPAPSPCELGDVEALEAVSSDAPPQSQLRALVQARHLLVRQTNACSSLVKPRLARVYFGMSCSLSEDTEYFYWHPEAVTLLRRHSRATANSLIRTCEEALGSQTRTWIMARHREAREQRNFVLARQLSAEMLRFAQDPEWRTGFQTEEFDLRAIRDFQVQDLDDLQVEAGRSNDLTAAAQWQQELVSLSTHRDYRQTFMDRGLTPGLLQLRTTALQQRFDVQTVPQVQQRIDAQAAPPVQQRIDVQAVPQVQRRIDVQAVPQVQQRIEVQAGPQMER